MFSSRYLLYFLISFVLVISACDRNQNEPDEPYACNSVDMISPDTNAVIFTVKTGNDYTINQLKGGIETTLIAQSGYDFWWPKLSPNKQEIICYRSPGTDAIELNDFSQAELWKFNADGTGGHKILDLLDFGWDATGCAQWTPNGKRIIMAAENEDPAHNNIKHWHIYVTDTAGNNPIKVSPRSSYFAYPDVSSDFTKITYCAWPSPLQSGTTYDTELHIASLDTNSWTLSAEQRVTNNSRAEENSNYSTDGGLIVFHSYSTELDYTIHTSTATGGTVIDIPAGGRIMRDPAFKNATQLMIVLRHGSACLHHLVPMNYDGTNESIHYRKLNKHFYQPDL